MNNRIPNVYDVLTKRCSAPLNIYNFYLYVRNEEHGINFFDMWLDIGLLDILTRIHFQELEKSHSIATQSSSTLGLNGSRVRTSNPSNVSYGFLDDYYLPNFGPLFTEDMLNVQALDPPALFHNKDRASYLKDIYSYNYTKPFLPSNSMFTQDQLSAFRQKLANRYLTKESPFRVSFPSRLVNPLENASKDQMISNPNLFEGIHSYIFHYILKPAYARFLEKRMKHNISTSSYAIRFLIGYTTTFAAYWLGFCGIFLEYSRKVRVWTLLPFFIGFYNLTCSWFCFDPLLAFVGYFETKTLRFSRIENKKVRHHLQFKAFYAGLLIAAFVAANTAIFSSVPSVRL
ncbi:regulator-G-protein signaling domain-containing protein [Schizosaccharomyces cryophilus OY26]|uniref:Regulator-G-protein signaling domain-containing protein n=1 Tax=Schizosaccharomyces cryophilus (strain OY26 / ATCC MYA-4695 / CBS 11777 / NBRC 106824 / NRRL Y48691) TaxID=653667 RepID=S9XK11_SCHCR|nr:regulator-G-protein signaling domain-containing protein [Schizosaccharomyces cryophilus OY26]EPY54041.1 regulator-G-protein signaling domain-containing protein [Schizosaccharomyces cryophilus OY26]